MIIIIAIVIGFPLLIIAVNKLSSVYYNREYTDADKGAESKNYVISKLNIPQRLSFHFSSDRAATPGEESGENITSHIFYDKTLQKAFVATEGYYEHKEYGRMPLVENFAIDNNGNITKTDSIPPSAQLIKDQLIPFQKWHDKSQVIYMRHFAKQDFDPPSLNPFHGMGNPTGGGQSYYWEGPGYYDVKFKNDVLKVKFPCKSGAFLFSNDYDYNTGLSYYILPDKDIAFIVDYKNYEPTGLYMIKHK